MIGIDTPEVAHEERPAALLRRGGGGAGCASGSTGDASGSTAAPSPSTASGAAWRGCRCWTARWRDAIWRAASPEHGSRATAADRARTRDDAPAIAELVRRARTRAARPVGRLRLRRGLPGPQDDQAATAHRHVNDPPPATVKHQPGGGLRRRKPPAPGWASAAGGCQAFRTFRHGDGGPRRRDPHVSVRARTIPRCGSGARPWAWPWRAPAGLSSRPPGSQRERLEIPVPGLPPGPRRLPRRAPRRPPRGCTGLQRADAAAGGRPDLEAEPQMVCLSGDLRSRERGDAALRRQLARLDVPHGALRRARQPRLRRRARPVRRRAAADRPRRHACSTSHGRRGARCAWALHRVAVAGVDPRRTGKRRPRYDATRLVPPDADLAILLTHYPSIFDTLQPGWFDLVLAGHLHGGQICIPYPGGKVRLSHRRGPLQRGRVRPRRDDDAPLARHRHDVRALPLRGPARGRDPRAAGRLRRRRAGRRSPCRTRPDAVVVDVAASTDRLLRPDAGHGYADLRLPGSPGLPSDSAASCAAAVAAPRLPPSRTA